MDTTQVTLIHKILAAADERNLPLWIGGGWAIDARLGRVTRKHDDIDLTFPGERRGELEAIVEMLGGRVMEELDYGFLAEIGDELLDCEPAWWADEAYEIAEAPQGSCPEAAEGVIAGRQEVAYSSFPFVMSVAQRITLYNARVEPGIWP